ncbi:MAG: hypothetical protein P1V35_02660 [Planctomycetota bacterium]|nr:hypothetical protein [Planctomycetota bacterium]
MLNKNDILSSMLDEIRIVRHLATKVPAGGLEYRPTEGQRTTLEVLRYLAFCAMGGATSMIDGNWDGYREWSASTESISGEEIPAALDRQEEGLKELFGNLSDEDFANKTAKHPLGHELSLGRALLEVPLKWMVGYRMQLFLYIKSAGNGEIGTANCWGGIDMPKPAASE